MHEMMNKPICSSNDKNIFLDVHAVHFSEHLIDNTIGSSA